MAHHIFVMRAPDHQKLLDRSHQPMRTRRALSRTRSTPKRIHFSELKRTSLYNRKARYLPIRKIVNFINHPLVRDYKNQKVCKRFQCTIPKKKGLTVPGPLVKGVSSIVDPWPVFSLESLYPWWYTHFRMLKSNFLSVNEDWLAFAEGANRLRIVATSRSHRRLTCGRRPAVILCGRAACTTKGRP